MRSRSGLQYRIPIRGGNWNNGDNAGLFYLNLNNTRDIENNDIGFRVALIKCRNFNITKLKVCNEQKEIMTVSINERQKYSCSSARLVTVEDNTAWRTL